MFGRSGIVFGCAGILLAGCGLPAMVEGDQVVYVAEAPTDVERTASCLYLALEKVHGARTAKVDLPTEGKAYVDINGDGSRFYRFALSKSGKGRTKIEGIALKISSPGQGLNDDKIYNPIKPCVL